jgi:parallel beta-helix repeat protein
MTVDKLSLYIEKQGVRFMKISKILALMLFVLMTKEPAFSLSGPYLGEPAPGLQAEIFAPGIVSVNGRMEDCVTFTPDGLECGVGIISGNDCRIHYMRQEEGQWTNLTRAYFRSGAAWTFQFTPDGLGLVFISSQNSPDIWMYERERITDNWSTPFRLGTPVSLSSSNEWAPSMTLDKTLYFVSGGRAGGRGHNDLYRAPYNDGQYTSVENLGSPINTSSGEQSSFVAADESFILFCRNGTSGYNDDKDIFISLHNSDDTWTVPSNLGPEVNTNLHERCPYVTIDNKYLFFTRRSGNTANIYWIETRIFLPDPNGPIENLSSGQRFGSIQCAINYANSGDTIVLQPGIYHENVNLNSKNIILQSVDPNSSFYIGGTILNGDSANSSVITLQENSETCEIAGLTIRSGLIGIKGIATNATIRNCRIIDNTNHGLELLRGSNSRLQNCLITSNGQTGITMLTGPGRSSPLCAPLIENCVIVQNGSENIVGGEPVIIDSIVSQ